MTRITVNILHLKEKKRITEYTQKVIEHHFSNPLEDTQSILRNSINFFREESLGEPILKQSLLKGLFPRLSYRRQIIEKEMRPNLNEKIVFEAPNNKSDFRLIGETLTANRFAETSSTIRKIIMNYEDPKKTQKMTSNVNDDVTIHISIGNKDFITTADIKAGNNANEPLSGVLASAPYTPNYESYAVINAKTLNLDHIQDKRIIYFKELLSKTNSLAIRDISERLQCLNELPLDIIQKNILIQEEMFKAISTGICTQSPSFYAAHIVPYSNTLHDNFFNKLEPYVNKDIFNSKADFKKFMTQALITYDQTIQEILHNIKQNRNLLKESGLSDITDGIFN